jgi:hypothetical protein
MLASERWFGTLVRSYPVASGTYVVNLLFMEAFSGACSGGVGFRIFDVFIEGSEVLPNFDQVAVAQAENTGSDGCGVFVTRSFVVSVTDGFLDIQLGPASVDNAALKAIKVIALPPSPTGCESPPAGDMDCDGLADGVDPCPDQALNMCDGLALATCSAAGGNCGLAGDEILYDSGPTGPTLACDGGSWAAETGPNLGNQFPGSGEVTVDSSSVENLFGCSNPATEAMFKSEAWLNTLVRNYPVANGDYVVNLFFMEAFIGACGGVGSRVFDITIEGNLVYDDFDQLAAAQAENTFSASDGCGVLVVRSAVVTVSDGSLDIQLGPASIDNGALKAIKVIALPSPG